MMKHPGGLPNILVTQFLTAMLLSVGMIGIGRTDQINRLNFRYLPPNER